MYESLFRNFSKINYRKDFSSFNIIQNVVVFMFGKRDCGPRMGALPQNWGPRFTLYHTATFEINIGNRFCCLGWTAIKRKDVFLPHLF